MTLARIPHLLCSLVILFFTACNTLPKFSYHTTTIHIPDVKDKGDFSAFGTIGTYHCELQAAYSPIDKIVMQGSTMIGGDARTSGEKRSYEVGLGYQFKPNKNNIITVRGLWGSHRNNNSLFDPPRERCGTNFEGKLDEFSYAFHNWAVQTDYIFTSKKTSLIFGSKLTRANYDYAYMIELEGVDAYNLLESRNNFHSYFISLNLGISAQLTSHLSFTSYVSVINQIFKEKAISSNSQFDHRYNTHLWSNGLTYTLKSKKRGQPNE